MALSRLQRPRSACRDAHAEDGPYSAWPPEHRASPLMRAAVNALVAALPHATSGQEELVDLALRELRLARARLRGWRVPTRARLVESPKSIQSLPPDVVRHILKFFSPRTRVRCLYKLRESSREFRIPFNYAALGLRVWVQQGGCIVPNDDKANLFMWECHRGEEEYAAEETEYEEWLETKTREVDDDWERFKMWQSMGGTWHSS